MPVKHITVKEAHASQAGGAIYVDVRSIPEFAEGHPQGAVNVPLLHLDARTGQLMPNRDFLAVMKANFPPDAPLLIGCKVGGRSAQAAQMLADSGFADVTNVLGGFHGARDPFTGSVRAEGWTQANLPAEPETAPGMSYRELSARPGQGK